MRGSKDDAIEARQVRGAEGVAEAVEAPPSVPGGKALARLLEVLESAGYERTAATTVEQAVPADAREELSRRAARFAAAPSEPRYAPEPRPAGQRRRPAKGAGAEISETVQGAAAEEVAQAYLAVGEQSGPPTGIGPQWRSLGPWTILNGQTYGASRVNVSGRVSAIAVDPSDPAHVLVGGANGGVWESRNRGASWAPRTDYAATLAVGAVVFDPGNPATAYAGLGEGNWWWWLGAGVLRSTNGGTTWSTLCTSPFIGLGFYDLVVDRANGQHLLAGTTGGLYESADGGVTWTQRRTARTWSISMAPAGGAAAEVLAACGDGLQRSSDSGTTWTAVALPGAPAKFDRLAVAIASSNPDVAYAWGAGGATAFLWRRAGGHWTAVPAPPGVRTGQAWYDWFVAVAPDLDTQVYCGAIEVHRGDRAGTAWTWRNLTDKNTSGDSIHPDQHAIAFEPGQANTIYVGNDGGLYRSPDRGITWQHCNNGLVISEFEYLAQDCGSSRWLIGGTQDNGTQRWTGSAIWQHVADGDGGDCGVNRADPRVVFHTYYGMSLERSTSRGDWGTWNSIAPPVPAGEGSLFYPPFECSATNGDTIAMGGDAVYVSRDNGTTWTRMAFPAAGRASAMYIPDADHIYVGTTAGRIYSSTFAATGWGTLTRLATPRTGAVVSDLYVEPGTRSRMWATHRTVGGGRVWRSDDGGANWADRSAGLPGLPMNAVEVDRRNRDRVWVAADLGVYQSRDGGGNWTDFSNGLPNAFVGDLLFHPHAWVLRAGLRNRGVWEIPVDGWMTQPACGMQWTGHLAGKQTMRWFTFRWPATWHVLWTIMPTTPRPGAPQLTWTVKVERADAEYVTYWITVRNLTPDPCSFEGRYCILSRY